MHGWNPADRQRFLWDTANQCRARSMCAWIEMDHLDGREESERHSLERSQRILACLRVSGGFRRHFACCAPLRGIGSTAKKINVEFGFEKALIGIFLHQTLDTSLSSIECFQRRIINTSNSGHACLGIEIHLEDNERRRMSVVSTIVPWPVWGHRWQ